MSRPLKIARQSQPSSAEGSERSVGRLLLLALILFQAVLSGCSQEAVASHDVSTPFNEQQHEQQGKARATSLNIVIDLTGSPVESAVKEAWDNLLKEMPAIVQLHLVNHITLWGFEGDGWKLSPMQELSIPAIEQQNETELGTFGNVKHALDDDRQRRRLEELHKVLKGLTSAVVIPQVGHEARNSNIVALLRRISEERSAPSIFILITDMADTKFKKYPLIVAPQPGVQVLVLVVPSKAKDTIMTLGRNASGDEQFEIRRNQVGQKNTWVVLVPYFTRELVTFLKT